MKRPMRIAGLFLIVTLFFPKSSNEISCGLKNTSFREGEKITYKIFYTLAGIYVDAGEVNFSCGVEVFSTKTVYHMTAIGKTFPFYDNFYRVRDRYESFIDTGDLRPYKFVREVNEGGIKKFEQINFNKDVNTAITDSGVYKVPECVQDVLSAMYYARNMNLDNVHPGDKIPFTMFLDNKVYPSYIRYMGREIIKTKYGRFHAIRFKALLIKGTLFQAGEKMTVWVTDDPNHIPVRVESPIVVGSVKADMMDFRNLRAPLSSLISVR
jgi:Protein of unknown function (DUF3108)